MVKNLHRAASVLGLLLCCLMACAFWQAGVFDSREALTRYLAQFGWAGPAVFIAFQAVQVVLPILPGGLGCLAGVVLFGPWQGFWYNYTGICLVRWQPSPSPAPAGGRCWKRSSRRSSLRNTTAGWAPATALPAGSPC